jgi:hypothetical protein
VPGSDRARFCERLLDNLARDLRRELGIGFTQRYLDIFRQFYLRYPIAQSLISQFALTLPYAFTVSLTVYPITAYEVPPPGKRKGRKKR